ncbi:MAG: hypothetical protein K0S20_142 [Patescibacteria group bacterium]|nr:hypothetical protein [Patescibacteria group bacterium]
MRALTPSTPGGINVAERDPKELRHTRLLDPSQFQGAIEMNVYANKIATVSFVKNELIGIIIESAVLSQAQRQVFEMLWNVASELKDLKK